MSTPELYELVGPNWKFPVLLKWHDTIAQFSLHPEVLLLNIQREAILAWLQKMQIEERDGFYWAPYHVAKEMVMVSLRSNPEEVVEWMPMRPERTKEEKVLANEFTDGYVRSEFAVIKQSKIAEVVWLSFCKYMLHCLLNEQQSVDLFFAKLMPLQARRNWKEVATTWEKKNVTEEQFSPSQESMVRRGVANFLTCERMLAFQKFARPPRIDTPYLQERYRTELTIVSWMLEIVPLEPFYEMAKRLEKAKKSCCRLGYWNRTAYDTLKRQLPYALEAYSSYIKEAVLPHPLIYRAKQHIIKGVPLQKKWNNREAPSPIGVDRSIFGNPVSEHKCSPENVVQANEALREMSPIPEQGMWEDRVQVSQS